MNNIKHKIKKSYYWNPDPDGEALIRYNLLRRRLIELGIPFVIKTDAKWVDDLDGETRSFESITFEVDDNEYEKVQEYLEF